jgi:hypothetical protein
MSLYVAFAAGVALCSSSVLSGLKDSAWLVCSESHIACLLHDYICHNVLLFYADDIFSFLEERAQRNPSTVEVINHSSVVICPSGFRLLFRKFVLSSNRPLNPQYP